MFHINETITDNLRIWAPLISLVLIVSFFGFVRCNRLSKLKRLGHKEFMKDCKKKHKESVCRKRISMYHKECFEETTSLEGTGNRTSRYALDVGEYVKCTYDSEIYKAKKAAERKRKRAKKRRKGPSR